MYLFGELFALLTAFLWSGSSIAFSAAARRIGSVQLNVDRLIFATIILFLTIVVLQIEYTVSSKQIIYLIISGIIGLVVGDSFLFRAYEQIGARYSMVIMATSPALTAILAFIFLGEVISILGIFGMLITLSGIFLVVSGKKEVNAKYHLTASGIFNGFMGSLGQAGGLIFAKFAFEEGELHSFVATFIRIFSSTIILFCITLLIRKYKNPFKLYKENKKALTTTLAGTILGPYLGITFSLVAITYAKMGIAATLMSTMPILMLPLVKWVEKEKLTWRAISGAVLAVLGVAILFLR